MTSSVRKYSAPHNGDVPASGGKDGDIEIQQKVRKTVVTFTIVGGLCLRSLW